MLAFLIQEDQYKDMPQVSLSKQQKSILESRHKRTRNGKERDRIKAVLLRSEGWTLEQIAQALRIHESSIKRHIEDFRDKNKLFLSSGGSESKLNEEQKQELIAHITKYTYTKQTDIITYIKKTYQVNFTVPGINKWLKRHGFSYKKPKSMPYKVDLEKQAEFIEKYQKLKDSLGENEGIFFMDAVHPTQATKVSYGWIKTGTDKPIQTTGSRTRVNIIGAIQLKNIAKAVASQYDTVNGESVQDFLTQLRQQNATMGTIHLIADGAPYHKSGEVKQLAETLDIQIHILPPYSPNLNPIERLWKFMNEKVRNNQCFHSAKEFRQKIQAFFEQTLPNVGASLDSWINDNFQTFSPALVTN